VEKREILGKSLGKSQLNGKVKGNVGDPEVSLEKRGGGKKDKGKKNHRNKEKQNVKGAGRRAYIHLVLLKIIWVDNRHKRGRVQIHLLLRTRASIRIRDLNRTGGRGGNRFESST